MGKDTIYRDIQRRTGYEEEELYLHTAEIKNELKNIPLDRYSEEEWINFLFDTFIEKSGVIEEVLKENGK